MRTNITIDDKLMDAALRSGAYSSKKEAVEKGLKLLVNMNSQKKLLELESSITWDGDLDEMRRD